MLLYYRFCLLSEKQVLTPGADLGYSREGWMDFKKLLKVLGNLFIRVTKLIIRALPKRQKRLCFGHIFCATDKNLKNKQAKKRKF